MASSGTGAIQHNSGLKDTDTIRINVASLTPEEKTLAVNATESWASLIDYDVKITNDADAHITFTNEDDDHAHVTRVETGNPDVFRAVVNVPKDLFTIKSNQVFVYLHEVGHALGLGHPGPYPRDDTLEVTFWG